MVPSDPHSPSLIGQYSKKEREREPQQEKLLIFPFPSHPYAAAWVLPLLPYFLMRAAHARLSFTFAISLHHRVLLFFSLGRERKREKL